MQDQSAGGDSSTEDEENVSSFDDTDDGRDVSDSSDDVSDSDDHSDYDDNSNCDDSSDCDDIADCDGNSENDGGPIQSEPNIVTPLLEAAEVLLVLREITTEQGRPVTEKDVQFSNLPIELSLIIVDSLGTGLRFVSARG